MKTFRIMVMLACGSFLASAAIPALAQSDKRIGSRVKDRLIAVPNASMADNDTLMYRIAECSANLYEPAVRAVLAARDADSLDKAKRPLHELRRCDFVYEVDANAEVFTMALDLPTMRGLYAEAMLRNKKADDGLQPLPLVQNYNRDWFAITGRPTALDDMATCVAAIDPAGIQSIFKTKYGSEDEKLAVAALVPDYGQCLQTGFELRSDSKTIRQALAEALYHRAFDPPVAPASGNPS